MVLSTALFGAASGVLVRVWANGLGKKRLLARPWNHVMFAMVGGYIGYNYMAWENDLLQAVNEKRAERGMPMITRQSLSIAATIKTTKNDE